MGISKELSDENKIHLDKILYEDMDQNMDVCGEATDAEIIAQLVEND